MKVFHWSHYKMEIRYGGHFVILPEHCGQSIGLPAPQWTFLTTSDTGVKYFKATQMTLTYVFR